MRLSRKIKKSITVFNLAILTFAILAGFLIAKLSSVQINKNNSLENSALRVANAFEIYNEKRFKEN